MHILKVKVISSVYIICIQSCVQVNIMNSSHVQHIQGCVSLGVSVVDVHDILEKQFYHLHQTF